MQGLNDGGVDAELPLRLPHPPYPQGDVGMLVGRARRGVAACLGVGAGRRCAVSCDRRWWREGWHVVLVQVVRGRGPCDQLHGWRVAVLLLGQLRDVPLGPLGGTDWRYC